MESIGLSLSLLDINKVNSNGDIVYEVNYDFCETNYITVDENDDGDLILDGHEGNLHNTLVLKADGYLILDRYKVDFGETTITYDEDSAVDDTISFDINSSKLMANGRSSQYSTKPFKGKASNYNTFIKTYSKANIDAGRPLEKIGTVILSTVIGAIFSELGILGTVVGATTGVAITDMIAQSLKSVAEVYGPSNNKYFSFKVSKYEYPQTTNMSKYYKYSGKYYIKKNYKGYSVSHTFYEYNYFW